MSKKITTLTIEILGRNVDIEFSELDDFIDCDKFVKNIFNFQKNLYPNEFNPEIHNSLILKVKVSDKDFDFMISNSHITASLYFQAVENYLKKYLKVEILQSVKAVNCNQFEQQTQYFIP